MSTNILGNRPANKYHNPQLAKLSKYNVAGVSQNLLVTAYSQAGKPVNYIVPAKTDSYELAAFIASFETQIDVCWVTCYDLYPFKDVYEYQTCYVMYIKGFEDEIGTWHAIPMFTDSALKINHQCTKIKILGNMYSQNIELTETEYSMLDKLNIIDDTFATLCHYKNPVRPLLRTIKTGNIFKGKKYLPPSLSLLQVTSSGVFPFAFVPASMQIKFKPQGENQIMTDYEAHEKILACMKYPY